MPEDQPIEICENLALLAEQLIDAGPPEDLISLLTTIVDEDGNSVGFLLGSN